MSHSGPYKEAANLLNPLLTNKSKSLKTLAFGGGKNKKAPSKSAYATVCRCLEHKVLIDAILDLARDGNRKSLRNIIFDKGAVKDHGLAYVMLYEILFGKYKRIRGGGVVARLIKRYEADLNEAKNIVLEDSDIKEVLRQAESIQPFPRYVRVNTLKVTAAEAVQTLQDGGYEVYADNLVPNLLVLPPKTDLHAHPFVTDGKLILQDKSSCFSALALVGGGTNPIDGDILDACAAPGNKTTHAAALVGDLLSNKSKIMHYSSDNSNTTRCQKVSSIYALDRDSKRLKILKNRVELLCPPKSNSGVTVHPLHLDFLTLEPDDPKMKNLRCILLDPSCSGSGIVSQPDRVNIRGEADAAKRLETLSNFQITALKHAMTFSQVERIVYSTCSVHDIENEHVVATCLKEYNDTCKMEKQWRLISPNSLKDWERRGKVTSGLTSEQAQCLVRCDARLGDGTNGFFVAYFERESQFEKADSVPTRSYLSGNNALNGISVYDGQFDNHISKADANDKHPGEKRKVMERQQLQDCKKKQKYNRSKKSTVIANASNVVEAKSSMGVSCNKKSKKLKWKQRQAAAKAARLKKEKDQST